METIAQEAKRLLEPIPEEQWCTGESGDAGAQCLLRHLGDSTVSIDNFLNTSSNFRRQFCIPELSFEINDGLCPKYPQETPKQRSIAFIDDMIKAGY